MIGFAGPEAIIKTVLVTSGLSLAVAGFALVAADTAPYRRLQDLLERPWRVERMVYRHHRLVGSAIILGALVLLGVLGIKHTHLSGAGLLKGSGARAAEFLVWVTALMALVVGLVVWVRPSALKRVEALANRSIQLSPAKKIRAQRPIGVLLLLAGITCLAVAARMVAA